MNISIHVPAHGGTARMLFSLGTGTGAEGQLEMVGSLRLEVSSGYLPICICGHSGDGCVQPSKETMPFQQRARGEIKEIE